MLLFFRMEETVRSLLQSQGSPEQKKEEPAKITAYQVYHVSDSWLDTNVFGLLFFFETIQSPLF